MKNIRRIFDFFRRRANRQSEAFISNESFTLYQYLDEEGRFDYETYRRIQEDGNKRKLNEVWVIKENIAFLSNIIFNHCPKPSLGLCHGTRQGKEQMWFREFLECDVFGTEISETANDFPYTIQMDFHQIKPEWKGNVDFIYSNSLDHSFDPRKCLRTWMSCLKPNGLCILEHSSRHTPAGASELDPFGASIEVMPYLILEWSGGEFGVTQVRSAPERPNRVQRMVYFIVQNFR